jgi:hypothetical protein
LDAASTSKGCDHERYHGHTAEASVTASKQSTPRNYRRDRHHEGRSHHNKANSFFGEGKSINEQFFADGSPAAAAGFQFTLGQGNYRLTNPPPPRKKLIFNSQYHLSTDATYGVS